MLGGEGQPLVSGKNAFSASLPTENPSWEPSSPRPICRLVTLFVAAVVFGILLIVALFQFTFVVRPGEVGVRVTLGHVRAFGPGLQVKAPYVSHVTRMSSKTQKLEDKNTIPTKEGLNVGLDTAILFHLDSSKAAELFTEVGPNYVDILLKPEVASVVRGLTSESEAKALYTSGRTIIQDAVKIDLQEKLGPRGIMVEDVLLKDVVLPDELSKSIEEKMQAEQEAVRMQFVLQKERQEAERKAIEAKGIADFQRIVAEGVSERLLKWKGIEATEKLAGSRNSKLVIMGNGPDGLPVILSSGHSDFS